MLARLALVLPAVAACSPAAVLNVTTGTAGLTVTQDVAYEAGSRHMLDIYRPAAATGLPVVVFLYGGSWRTGDKGIYPFLAASLARKGAVVMVPDYQVYPQVQFPAFLQDNAAAVAWAVHHAADYGGQSGRLYLIGHSAGAYNALMLGLDPQWLAGAGLDRGALAGVVGLAGPYDFLPITDPDIIPVFASAEDQSITQPINFADGHNPPLLLLAGVDDTTVKPRNTVALAARVAAAGGPVTEKLYPGVGHLGIVAAFSPLLRSTAPVLEDVWSFIAAHPATGL